MNTGIQVHVILLCRGPAGSFWATPSKKNFFKKTFFFRLYEQCDFPQNALFTDFRALCLSKLTAPWHAKFRLFQSRPQIEMIHLRVLATFHHHLSKNRRRKKFFFVAKIFMRKLFFASDSWMTVVCTYLCIRLPFKNP